jgi:hypothetical protein
LSSIITRTLVNRFTRERAPLFSLLRRLLDELGDTASDDAIDLRIDELFL